MSYDNMHVISGTDNGMLFIWDTFTTKTNRFLSKLRKRESNSNFESVRVSGEKTPVFAIGAPDKILQLAKMLESGELAVGNIIVTLDGVGTLKVFYNYNNFI